MLKNNEVYNKILKMFSLNERILYLLLLCEKLILKYH